MYYALQCFEKASFINNVILVTSEDCVDYCQKKIVEKYGFRKVEKIVVGGKERYDSVYAGLLACGETDYVYIHDGIRPFITREILERALDGARETGACVVGMPSKDTVKIVDKEQFVTKRQKEPVCGRFRRRRFFVIQLSDRHMKKHGLEEWTE